MKFINFARKWLKEKRGEVKDVSLTAYQNQINLYMIPFCEEYKVEEIDNEVIIEFEKYLESMQLSKYTKENVVGLLNSMLNPQKDKTKKKEKNAKKVEKSLSKEEVDVLMDYLKKNPSRNNMLIILQLITGISIGELCAIQGKHIDMKKGTIIIESTVSRVNNNAKNKVTKTVLQITKATHERMVFVPQWFVKYLKPFKVTKKKFIATGDYRTGNTRTIQSNMERISEKIGIKINSNILQAIFITGALQKGSTLKQVADFVGTTATNLERRGYEEENNLVGIFRFQESLQ